MPAKKGYKWYNNGKVEICIGGDCPEGFIRGRLPMTEDKKLHYKNNGLSNTKITQEQRDAINRKISETKQNKTLEEKEEYSRNISRARKGKGLGCIPWNKGTVGVCVAWNKGLHTEGHPRTAESLAKARQTCLERYGVDWACQRDEARFKGQDSQYNLKFEKLLIDNNIKYSREFPIHAYSYDFKVGKYLVEIDPFATHNSTWGIRGNPPKEHTYHITKSKVASDNGYFCIHIFDWDDPTKIINRFLDMKEVQSDDCILQEISKELAKKFLETYHPQNATNITKAIGLFYDDELVEVMTFSKPRYNKHYEWELSRVCAKPGLRIIGGCKKMLDYFKKTYVPTSIIVYCDLSKMDGTLYERLGFIKKNITKPTRHWYNPKVGKHYTDSFLWKKGFDRLFGTNYGKTASNTELMLKHGFVEIYDCGQATYVYKSLDNQQ